MEGLRLHALGATREDLLDLGCDEPGVGGPQGLAGDDPFIMQSDGKGWLFAPKGMVDGPLPSPYMLFVHRVAPEWRDRIPAVVHVDGTARVQTVDDATTRLSRAIFSTFL